MSSSNNKYIMTAGFESAEIKLYNGETIKLGNGTLDIRRTISAENETEYELTVLVHKAWVTKKL